MPNFLSQIDFQKLSQPEYLFQISPPADGWYKYLTIIFVLMLALALYWIWKKPLPTYRKFFYKLISLFLIVGFFGLLLIFFRFEGIAYLGSRLMLLVLFLIFLVWSLLILYYRLIVLPQHLKKKKEKEKFEKYLPRNRRGNSGGRERKY